MEKRAFLLQRFAEEVRSEKYEDGRRGEFLPAGLADTHCHVHEDEYGAETAETVERAGRAGVTRILVIGSDMRTSRSAVSTAEKYASAGVFAAVGVHPHDASCLFGVLLPGASEDPADEKDLLCELRELADHPRVAAIGETGLDYYYDHSPRDQQRKSFRKHIRLAVETGKPLVVHGRDSYDDLIRILREEGGERIKAVVHCFSGSEEDARALLDMGYFLSFGGPLTFPKNEPLRELFQALPEDRILLETDSPWLSPHPFRGKRNEPSRVRLVYEKAAEIRSVPFEEFAVRIARNAQFLFGWDASSHALRLGETFVPDAPCRSAEPASRRADDGMQSQGGAPTC